ncbi:MAG: hypothetical protein ACOC0U_06530 [Desulfovibrionales bacterium]
MDAENENEIECVACSRFFEARFFSDVEGLCLACYNERDSMLRDAYRKVVARRKRIRNQDWQRNEDDVLSELEELFI